MSGGGEFRGALTAAKKHLETLDMEGRLDHIALRWEDLIELLGKRKTRTLIAIWDSTPAEKREEKADLIVGRAYMDPLHYHVARSFLADMVKRGEVLPPSLRKWAAQLIEGTAKRPPSKRSDSFHKRRNRALILGILVHRVATGFGINPTRSRESEHDSACDAVEKAWSDHVREMQQDRRKGFTTYGFERVKDFYYEAREIAQNEAAQFDALVTWLELRPFAQ